MPFFGGTGKYIIVGTNIKGGEGAAPAVIGDNNMALGNGALESLVVPEGDGNIAIGNNAGESLTAGGDGGFFNPVDNVIIGYSAVSLTANISGSVIVGSQIMNADIYDFSSATLIGSGIFTNEPQLSVISGVCVGAQCAFGGGVRVGYGGDCAARGVAIGNNSGSGAYSVAIGDSVSAGDHRCVIGNYDEPFESIDLGAIGGSAGFNSLQIMSGDGSTGDTIAIGNNSQTQLFIAGKDFSLMLIPTPDVTGSKGGNAALASLLTALANLGLITDSTT